MRLLPLALLLGSAPACTSYDCNSVTCANGCCDNGACFEGNGGKRYGAPCSGAGGGSGGSAGGAEVACLMSGRSCTEGGTAQCCFPMACVAGKCATCIGGSGRCDNSSLPCCAGSCSSSGYCGSSGSCSYYSEPCNDLKPCCKSLGNDTYNDICVSERCTFCGTPDKECSLTDPYETKCCPGLHCGLKPGFSTVYVCQ